MFELNNYRNNDEFVGVDSTITTVKDFDYHSFYRAVVISNDDPEFLGRIRICIPSLHGDLQSANSNNLYPYAYPACFAGLGNQVGSFFLPPVGSFVFVTFEYSDEHRPIYFGGIPTLPYDGKKQYFGPHVYGGLEKEITERDIPSEYTGTQSIIYKSASGAIIYIDDNDTDNKVIIRDSKGKYLQFNSYTDALTSAWVQYIELFYDNDNYIQLSDNALRIKLGGHLVIFNKDNLVPGGGGGSTDAQTILWD